ncbi:hypothetical protein Tco_1440486 [Tanacetum coccineum]
MSSASSAVTYLPSTPILSQEDLDYGQTYYPDIYKWMDEYCFRPRSTRKYEKEDGPVDYPMDGGKDGDDNDGNSSGDDADDEDEDEEEVEEHLALANSAVVVPTVELVSPPEGTEPVTPPPSTVHTTELEL